MTALEYNLILTDRFQQNHGSFGDYSLSQVVWEVDQPEQIKWVVPDENPQCGDVILKRHEVQLRINGQTRAIGPVMQCDTDNGLHAFTAEGVLAYWRNLYIFEHGSLYYDDLTEQFDMAWALLNYGQQNPDWWASSPLSLSYNSPTEFRVVRGLAGPSGIRRARRYLWYDAKSIFSYLQEFNADTISQGFDYEIVMDDATGDRKFNCFYPRKMQDFKGYRFEIGKNITNYKYSEKVTDMGADVIYKGGTAGTVHFFGEYIDQNAEAYFGHHQLVLSSQYLDHDWLNANAKQQSRLRREPSIEPDFDVTVEDEILLTHKEGDLINLIIRDNRRTISGIYRIKRMTWNVDAGTVTLGVDAYSSLYPIEQDFVIP